MSNYNTFYSKVWLFLVLSLSMFSTHAQTSKNDTVAFDRIVVEMGTKRLALDYAHSFDQRARGLMFRTSMCADCGMLFEFESDRYAGFWMKNTFIPLDIAYVDRNGVIADIKPMFPHVLEPVPSSKKVLYAIEMNQGWFARNQIKVGDSIAIVTQPEMNERGEKQ